MKALVKLSDQRQSICCAQYWRPWEEYFGPWGQNWAGRPAEQRQRLRRGEASRTPVVNVSRTEGRAIKRRLGEAKERSERMKAGEGEKIERGGEEEKRTESG